MSFFVVTNPGGRNKQFQRYGSVRWCIPVSQRYGLFRDLCVRVRDIVVWVRMVRDCGTCGRQIDECGEVRFKQRSRCSGDE